MILVSNIGSGMPDRMILLNKETKTKENMQTKKQVNK